MPERLIWALIQQESFRDFGRCVAFKFVIFCFLELRLFNPLVFAANDEL